MKFFKVPSLIIAAVSAAAITAHAGQSERLNINTASAHEIDNTLVFVGAKTAQAIVNYRSRYGRFDSLNDLAQVKGVSKRLARYNRSRISFH
ncbi:ComEA family DNA-binding protein [Candidatus Sororendozoicomonas aggregata]|uniref:ComEA family DNA-binding protein n=1 Tax=Candidatus Sororendozoicomonas aggregata TaxID=3073239 RepID=UPI002ED0905F